MMSLPTSDDQPILSQAPVDPPGSPPRGPRSLLPRSIRSRLILLLLVLLLPGLAVEALSHLRYFESRQAEELQANVELARALSAAFNGYIADILHQEYTLGQVLSTAPPTVQTQAHPLLLASAREYPAVYRINYISPQGTIVASSEAQALGLDVRDRQYYLSAIQGEDWTVTDLFETRVGEELSFAIGRAVRDERGALRGIVVALVNPDELGGALAVERAEQGSIVILDRNLNLVYQYPEPSPLDKRRAWPEVAPLARAAQAGEASTGTVPSPVDRQNRVVGFVPIGPIGWVAGATRPEAAVLGPLVESLVLNFAMLSVVALLATAVAAVISRSITRPVRRLRSHALALARGEFPERVQLPGPSELQEVGSAFAQMARELQERQRQSASLLAEVERRAAELDATITAIADGVLIYDRAGQLVRTNPAAERILGLGEAERERPAAQRLELIRMRTADGKPLAREEQPAERALRGERVSGLFLVLGLPRGPEVWVSASAAPIENAEGDLLGAIVTYTNITALHRLQEEREEYVRAISHDLRAPLTIVLGQAQMVLRASDRVAVVRRGAEAIVTSARRMNTMIQDLVDASRLETGQLRLNPRALDLRRFVVDLRGRLEGVAGAERIRLSSEEDLPRVFADPDRLERILMNLLTNALKYSTPGTPVEVRLAARGGEVVTAVVDQGKGIPSEEIERLFERYYRSAEAREHREGLGLGLYITKGLVEAHGGRIWAESRVGQGSTFAFSIPTAREGSEPAS